MGESSAFENSNGDFFYPTTEGIIKVTQQIIPQKKSLTLVCIGDSRNEQNSSYRYTKELMDAIIRFNNTDNEFKINVTPVTYSDEHERERLLVELATSDSVDLIDTSLLPENSIKAGFLVDLLPYIDADEIISRDDFIPSLLSAMLKSERLYEYTDKFTLLTMLVNQSLARDHALWTTSEIQTLVQSGAWSCESRDNLLDKFVLASTAEFIDWNTMSCSFDSEGFKNWLNLLKTQPETIERHEQPLVFRVSSDFAGDAGLWAKTIVEGNYEVSGFPDTEYTGSYFVKLNSIFDYESPTIGENTRIGIMTASKNQDAAWRFVRTLMLDAQDSNIAEGIPVLKARFEKALSNSLSNEVTNQGIAVFDENDAEIVREQVYNTTKLVHEDEALLHIIRSEANMFFGGQKNLDDAVKQIQSRVSIYLAEQG